MHVIAKSVAEPRPPPLKLFTRFACLVGNGDTEALEVCMALEGSQKSVHIIYQQGHVNAIKANVLECRVVEERGAGVGNGVANDAKDFGSSGLSLCVRMWLVSVRVCAHICVYVLPLVATRCCNKHTKHSRGS